MPGFPQLREVGWLYGDDPTTPYAVVRLYQRMDGSGGWYLVVADPASGPDDPPVDYPDEQAARAELKRLYAEGEQRGTWRVRQPDGY